MDSCFVLVRTHQYGIAFQPQAMKLQGRVHRTALRLGVEFGWFVLSIVLLLYFLYHLGPLLGPLSTRIA